MNQGGYYYPFDAGSVGAQFCSGKAATGKKIPSADSLKPLRAGCLPSRIVCSSRCTGGASCPSQLAASDLPSLQDRTGSVRERAGSGQAPLREERLGVAPYRER